jgi:hypothetical protein
VKEALLDAEQSGLGPDHDAGEAVQKPF